MDKLLLKDCSPEQIENLNRFQSSGRFHPFTCGNRSDPGHEADREGILMATSEGWTCRTCGYSQDWCHPMMATAEASKPFEWPARKADDADRR